VVISDFGSYAFDGLYQWHAMITLWNNCKKKLMPVGLAGLMVLACACAQLSMQAEPQYDIGFLNNTGQRLDGVDVYYWDARVATASNLVKSGRATYGSVTMPIPSEAELRWDERDKHYAVKTKLEGVIPKGFGDDGTIYFVINTNGTVDVKPIKFGDTDAVVKLEKAVHPAGEYRLGFVNKTGHDLQAVSVYYDDQPAGSAGNILARVKIGYSDALPLPLPAEAEVRWVENDTPHRVKVDLKGTVPKGYAEGTIFLFYGATTRWRSNPSSGATARVRSS
jgi:hypothetical protein